MDKILEKSSGNHKENIKRFIEFTKFVKTKKDKRFSVFLEGIKIFDKGEEIGHIWVAISNTRDFFAGDIMAHINTKFGYSRKINSQEKLKIIKEIFSELITEYNLEDLDKAKKRLSSKK